MRVVGVKIRKKRWTNCFNNIMAEIFTVANIVFVIAVIVLILASIALYLSTKIEVWGGVAIGALYLQIIVLGGFPLTIIPFVILLQAGLFAANSKEENKLVLKGGFVLLNICYICQWLIWRYALQSIIENLMKYFN